MRSTAIYVLVIGLMFMPTTPAHAYLDPITGSFLIQGLVGAAAAVIVGVKRIRNKLLQLLGFRKSNDEKDQ
jgi:hypothetical protein